MTGYNVDFDSESYLDSVIDEVGYTGSYNLTGANQHIGPCDAKECHAETVSVEVGKYWLCKTHATKLANHAIVAYEKRLADFQAFVSSVW